VSHAAEGPTLLEHLGLAREPLDRFLDLSPTGRIDLGAGYDRVRLDANWKMYVENSSDNYHANFTHASAFSSPEQKKMSAAVSRDASLAIVRALGNGHSDVDFRPEQRAQGGILFTGNASAVDPDDRRAYMRALAERLGEQQATTLVAEGPPTVYVFPNLFVIQQDVRRLEPVGVGRSHLYQHPALLEGAPDAINEQRLSRHEAAYGPAGFVLSDDIEMFARNQRIVAANPDHVLKISRGLHRETTDEHGAVVSHVTDETGIRDMWRNYLRYMAEAEAPA
jgi:phenylpropionate dioxygenase-like ring-hydroxylating dioxygenase large terminal subunit